MIVLGLLAFVLLYCFFLILFSGIAFFSGVKPSSEDAQMNVRAGERIVK